MIDGTEEEMILKCLQGRADAKEYEASFNLIHSDKSHLEFYRTMRDAWVASGIVTSKNEYDCIKAWRRISWRTGISLFSVS
jgi:hypothetical protein